MTAAFGIPAPEGGKQKVLYLFRHGEVVGDSRLPLGQNDVPLSENGRRQMEAQAVRMQDVPVERMICSDLLRTRESAELMARSRGLDPEPWPSLREIFWGKWEGLTFREMARRHPLEFAAREADLVGYRPPGGESFLDLAARALPAFAEILSFPERVVAVIAHAGVNRVFLAWVLGMPPGRLFRIAQDYGCLNRIEVRAAEIRVERLNSVSSDR